MVDSTFLVCVVRGEVKGAGARSTQRGESERLALHYPGDVERSVPPRELDSFSRSIKPREGVPVEDVRGHEVLGGAMEVRPNVAAHATVFVEGCELCEQPGLSRREIVFKKLDAIDRREREQ